LREQTEAMLNDPTNTTSADAVEGAVAKLRQGPKGIAPYHWELEFPEVFTGDEKEKVIGGFDAIVGNPPFAGKNTLLNAHADEYLPWLQTIHPESHGNSDLVAHFFRRAFNLLRSDGCFGLIATNTISQGDTRSTGLRWICQHGGTIYKATKRLKWPGEAAVVVSVVHVCSGWVDGPYLLNGRKLDSPITAYLFHAGGHGDPIMLRANAGKSFIGTYVLGMGFTFDDTGSTEVTTPIAEMHRLIAKDPRNAKRISPYIGGEEINSSPTQDHHRYVINFGDMTEQEARQWPDLMMIVEEKVKPARLAQKREIRARYWWRFGEITPALTNALRSVDTVLVTAFTSRTFAFAYQPSNRVFEHSVVVLPISSFHFFAVLQSRIHEIWARFFGSTMKDDACYTPSACFQTFPFPAGLHPLHNLERIGRDYYEFRAALMVRKNEGMTKAYSCFHNPAEDSSDLVRLRDLHDALDRAALDAYGWSDIQPKCEFIPEFDDVEEKDENERTKKKKYQYRWPDEIHDEVLARLLELNRQRALEEGQFVPGDTEIASEAKPKKTSNKKPEAKKAKGTTSDQFTINLGEA